MQIKTPLKSNVRPDGSIEIEDAAGAIVAVLSFRALAEALDIVRAVNAHQALVEACESARRAIVFLRTLKPSYPEIEVVLAKIEFALAEGK